MEQEHQPTTKLKAKKGFASMTLEQKKAIASAGGKAAHKQGLAHKFDSEKAREAGRKGGNTISKNKEHMALIGMKGGQARSKNLGLNRYDEMIKIGVEKVTQKDITNGGYERGAAV